ncbi:hypothetical protein YC2023_081439 [Brassica napus]
MRTNPREMQPQDPQNPAPPSSSHGTPSPKPSKGKRKLNDRNSKKPSSSVQKKVKAEKYKHSCLKPRDKVLCNDLLFIYQNNVYLSSITGPAATMRLHNINKHSKT